MGEGMGSKYSIFFLSIIVIFIAIAFVAPKLTNPTSLVTAENKENNNTGAYNLGPVAGPEADSNKSNSTVKLDYVPYIDNESKVSETKEDNNTLRTYVVLKPRRRGGGGGGGGGGSSSPSPSPAPEPEPTLPVPIGIPNPGEGDISDGNQPPAPEPENPLPEA